MKVGSEVKCHRVNTVQPPGGELTRGFLLFQTGRLSGPFLASGWRVARGAGSRQAPPLFPSEVSSGRATVTLAVSCVVGTPCRPNKAPFCS